MLDLLSHTRLAPTVFSHKVTVQTDDIVGYIDFPQAAP